MIKRTELLSIALVTVVALAVVSGAGVLCVQAKSIPPKVSAVKVTQDSVLVDCRHPAHVGCPVTVQFTLTNPNSELMATCVTVDASVSTTKFMISLGPNPPTILQPSESQLCTGTFTPSVAGQYDVNISIMWSIGTAIGTGPGGVFSPPTSSFLVIAANEHGHHNNGQHNNGHHNN